MEIPMLTQSDVERFLLQHVGRGVTNVSRIEQQGEWSLAYSFRDRSFERVVRFSSLDEDFQKDHFAANFSSSRLPIPRITNIGQALGGFYAISEKADGTPIDNLSQEEMPRMLPRLLDLLDALRLADISSTTGYGTWKSDGNAPHASWRESLLDIVNDRPGDRVSGWKTRLEASSIGIELFCQAYQELVSLVDFCPEERHLIHSDLLHFNLLVANSQITSVLDWGSAKYGDFLYELAWFSFWAPWFPSMTGIDFRKEALRRYASLGIDIPYFRERMKCYEIHIGLESLAYSLFAEYWDSAREVAEYMPEILSH